MNQFTRPLPELGQDGAHRLPAGALAYLNTRSALSIAGGAAVVCLMIVWLLDGGKMIAALACAVALFLVGLAVEPLLNRRIVRLTTYSVEPDFIYIARGCVIRKSVFLPTRQILNVETVEGPLLQRHGFAQIRFRSISAVAPLGPLDPATINSIRAAIGQSHDAQG